MRPLRRIGQSKDDVDMRQPGVGDLRSFEVEDRKFGQPLQMRQPGVGDPRAAQVEFREIG